MAYAEEKVTSVGAMAATTITLPFRLSGEPSGSSACLRGGSDTAI